MSSDILLSIACSIGKPLHLDETTAAQRMLSYARVLVNLDVTKSGPNSHTIKQEGDATIEIEVLHEYDPYSNCLSTCHLSAKSPFTNKPALLKTPSSATLLKSPTTTAKSKDTEVKAKESQHTYPALGNIAHSN